MKKLLIAFSAVAITLIATAATADAGQYVRYVAGYDRCGHPVYSYRYIPTPRYHSSRSYCQPSHSYHRSSHGYSHSSHGYSHRSYSRPSYSYRGSRSHGRSYCR